MAEAIDTFGRARWSARLDLGFQAVDDKTFITRRQHLGPLRIQKPFYPADGACHVYLLHPPGGYAGQDDLCIEVEAGPGTRALLTTPAANKAYRSVEDFTSVKQTLRVDGTLDWLPQGTILFGGSRVAQHTRIELNRSARMAYWDMVSIGRPAASDDFVSGVCTQSLEVYLQDHPLWFDRQEIVGDAEMRSAAWGMNRWTVMGVLLIFPADQDLLVAVREALEPLIGERLALSVTCVDGMLAIRGFADQLETLHAGFFALWQLVRPLCHRMPAHRPRIWDT